MFLIIRQVPFSDGPRTIIGRRLLFFLFMVSVVASAASAALWTHLVVAIAVGKRDAAFFAKVPRVPFFVRPKVHLLIESRSRVELDSELPPRFIDADDVLRSADYRARGVSVMLEPSGLAVRLNN